jgi:hypothetical protein
MGRETYHDISIHSRAELARQTRHVLAGLSRTDDNLVPCRRACVCFLVLREYGGDGATPSAQELISMLKIVSAEVYGEAQPVGFCHQMAILQIADDIIVGEREATATTVCLNDLAQAAFADVDLVCGREVAGLIVPPGLAFGYTTNGG